MKVDWSSRVQGKIHTRKRLDLMVQSWFLCNERQKIEENPVEQVTLFCNYMLNQPVNPKRMI